MNKKIISIIACVLLLTTVLPAIGTEKIDKGEDEQTSTVTDDWPMFCHDPERSGYTTSTGPDTSLISWNVELYPDDGWYASDDTDSGPVVANGYVYVNDENILYCLDIENGNEIWRDEIIGVREASPAVVDGKVYISAANITCLNALTGEKIWDSLDLLAEYSSYDCSPLVIDDKVYVAGDQIYCLDAEGNGDGTTTLIWNASLDDPGVWIIDSLVYGDGKLFINYHGTLFCINATDGCPLWQNTTAGGSAIPAYADGFIYLGSSDYYLYCFNATTGERIYRKYFHVGASIGSPVVVNDKIYVALSCRYNWDPYMKCLYALNGTEIWSHTFTENRRIISSPAMTADGKLYVGIGTGQPQHNRKGEIVCLNAETGQEIWKKTTSTKVGVMSSPAVAYGRLFIKYDGKIYCFGNGAPETPDTPEGPSSGVANQNHRFETSSTDPDGHYIKYYWDWGDGSPLTYCWGQSGDTVSSTHKWTDAGIYYNIRVKAVDRYDLESNWSNFATIYIYAPGAPEVPDKPSGPSSGGPGEELCFSTTSIDPDSDLIYFNWSWGDDSFSGWLGPYNSYENATACHTWSKGNYEIKVKAKDDPNGDGDLSDGNESDWSESHMVEIIFQPKLSIGDITGGVLKINAEIKNIGDIEITNVKWNITIGGGGIILAGKDASGTIDVLNSGDTEIVLDKPVFGFGVITITVTANADGVEEVVKTVDGFVLLFLVLRM